MTTKAILLEVAEGLAPDATLYDAITELEFRKHVMDGLDSLEAGERIELEEARKLIPKWIRSFPLRRSVKRSAWRHLRRGK